MQKKKNNPMHEINTHMIEIQVTKYNNTPFHLTIASNYFYALGSTSQLGQQSMAHPVMLSLYKDSLHWPRPCPSEQLTKNIIFTKGVYIAVLQSSFSEIKVLFVLI